MTARRPQRRFPLWTAGLVGTVAIAIPHADGPAHFIYFGRDRERIHEASFLETPAIAGAQLKYTWRELEPERDRYDFRELDSDLAFLTRHDKRLFVQLQEASFDENIVNVPDYLRTDPAFGGGAERQYEFAGDDEAKPQPGGWVARRWDPAVRHRFALLLAALGRRFDGRIEGINLPETAVEFGWTGKLYPPGFDPAGYRDAIRETMLTARAAFPNSPVIIYANFMPGEALPDRDHGYLRSLYRLADSAGVGVGGPDLRPHRLGQRLHSYPLIAARAPGIVAGVAVQAGNLADRNPATGRRVTVPEVVRFARDTLRLNYIFWGTQEPYYSQGVLPYLRSLGPAGR